MCHLEILLLLWMKGLPGQIVHKNSINNTIHPILGKAHILIPSLFWTQRPLSCPFHIQPVTTSVILGEEHTKNLTNDAIYEPLLKFDGQVRNTHG